jgi:hypothetical protein
MNGGYPDRIIVFRDGGSLSAMGRLIEHEVKPMLSAIKDLCPELKYYHYVVVSKRIPQRFFLVDKVKLNISAYNDKRVCFLDFNCVFSTSKP